MIDGNILFGLERINDIGGDVDTKYVSFITKNSGKVPLGSPGIARLDSYEHSEKHGRSFKAIFPFPFNSGSNPGHLIDIRPHMVLPKDSCWLDTHKMLEVDELEISNVSHRKIANHVNNRGNLTFSIKDKEKALKCILKFKEFIRQYKYSILLSHENRGGIAIYEEDNITTTFSFLKLSDCIPIFNTRRVDGVGVLIHIFGEEISKHKESLNYSVRTAMTLSNYKDNVLVVDGVTVCVGREVEPGYLQDATKPLKMNHAVVPKEEKKAKAKPKESSDSGVKFMDIESDYKLSIKPFDYGGSTTATYYSATTSTSGNTWS